jgi:glucose/arabinose dehydrogenase
VATINRLRDARAASVGVLGFTLLVVVLTTVVVPRVLARARADFLSSEHLTLAPVIKGLREPTFVVSPPDDDRLFVLERAGVIRVADAGGRLLAEPFLDLSDKVSSEGEQGLLGMAFHPEFDHNGMVYVDYTARDGSLQVARYVVPAAEPDVADETTAQTLLAIPKKAQFHNGGMLAFGPDNLLYVGVGDDEDPMLAQDLGSLNGKLLRLDVDSASPYGIPSTNPFVDRDGARGEVWAYGLRNPWRFSFDRLTGDLWIGDVGDTKLEEVDFQPAASRGGENYGWPMNEGTECLMAQLCRTPELIAPLVTYGHDMNCSLTGGYVYRGSAVPELVGTYIFGDLCTGGVFALEPSVGGGWTRVELGFQPIKISSFGEDADGEVYVVDMQGGVVYRIADGSMP